MTRELARRFNRQFKEVFPEPEGLVGRVARLAGTDGQAKMSKSIGNTIDLRDDTETVVEKVRRMYTDPTRLRATDPGHVEGNPVFMYHDAFNPNVDEVNDLKERYVQGRVGDVEVKQKLAKALNDFLAPIRDLRAYFEEHPDEVREALEKGSREGRAIAQETMALVKDAMEIEYLRQRT
jgi:tryptophanyl-tRNA synthetase